MTDNQRFQYTYNAEENLKSSFMSLKKADAAHAQQEGMPKAQVVRADPPGMEEQDSASSAFMMDESDRPMTRVELLRMIKEKPATTVMPSMHDSNGNEGGGRRKRR